MARVTELLGEPWTLLVLREAFLGTRRFNDFERELGIARNILSVRLKKLVEAGVLERTRSQTDRRVVEYRLSRAGLELTPVLVSLSQWACRWLCDRDTPLRFVEHDTWQEVPTVQVRGADGRILDARDLRMVAGPDADALLAARFDRLAPDPRTRDR